MSASSGSTGVHESARGLANTSPTSMASLTRCRSRCAARASDSGVLNRPDADVGTSTQRCPWTLSGGRMDGVASGWSTWIGAALPPMLHAGWDGLTASPTLRWWAKGDGVSLRELPVVVLILTVRVGGM